MTKITLFLIFLISFLSNAQSPPAIQWQRTLGGSDWDQGHSVWATNDGGSIIVSYSPSTDGNVTGNHGNGDYWVAKLDNSGNIQWQKSLGGSNYDMPHEIQQTSDGGYIVVGESSSIDGDVTGHHDVAGTYSDYWVVKLNSVGSIQWQKSIGGSSMDIAQTIAETSDGGYIIAGSSSSTDGDAVGHLPYNNTDLWVVKINSTGNIIWQKSYGGYSTEVAYSIKQTSDGGYVVAGSTSSNSGDITSLYGENDYWILKLDTVGNLQWQKTYGGSYNDSVSSVQQTSDGGYIIAGSSQSHDYDVTFHYGSPINYDAWIVKLNASGQIQWQKTLGGTGGENANSIQQLSDGGYIFAGVSSSTDGDAAGNPSAGGNFWIVRLNPSGNVLWQKSVGGSSGDIAKSIKKTSDGGFIIAGSSYSNNGDVTLHYGNLTYPDIWVVKLGTEVLSTNESKHENLTIYPNPTTDKLFVSGLSSDEAYEIYSLTGQRLKNGKTLEYSLDVKDLEKGTYFIKIKNKKQKFIKK